MHQTLRTEAALTFHSSLPVDLTVYNQLVPPHIPQSIEPAEMDEVMTRLRSSSHLDPSLLETLYDRLHQLPSPFMAASRLRLSGLVFPVQELVCISESDPATSVGEYRARSPACGDLEIRTTDDLSGIKDACLVHPWIRPLLDQEFSGSAATLNKARRALRLLTRLRQPFGALLFEPLSRVEYRRVAADCLIVARVREEVSLTEFVDNTTTIEVL